MDALIFIVCVLSLTFLICLIAGFVFRWLLLPLLVGFVARLLFLFLDYYGLFSPPGAEGDARNFTRFAYEWSQGSWADVFSTFDYSASYLYSSIGAVFFKLVGFNDLVLPSLNTLAGIVGILLVGKMAYDLWGEKASVISAFIMALFPFAIFNSVIALREEFSIVIFLMGTFLFLKWVAGRGSIWIFGAFGFFAVAIMIHPGWLGAMIGVAIYLGVFAVKTLYAGLRGGRTTRSSASKMLSAIALFSVALLIVAGSGGITLAKGITIGGEDEGGTEDLIESRFQRDPRGGSAYPGFIATGNPYAQPWLIPARIVYFVYSPFPWDLRSPRQLMGVAAALMYAFLSWRLYKGWNLVKRKEECIALMCMTGALIFIFAIGVTNVGTAIRHRTKFLGILTLLAASSFDKLKIRLRRH
ncbi:MAG: hypothetical protein EA345_14085 [Halomonas sp.]|nr:hypothetical protein [Halomonas sp.]TVP45505.1 MAG: hypothetical protein EA345_14085 [Halomonas sp.]